MRNGKGAKADTAVQFGTVDTTATAGTADPLPAQPSGYVEVLIGGVTKRLPFYD